jgi:hypothetical protein
MIGWKEASAKIEVSVCAVGAEKCAQRHRIVSVHHESCCRSIRRRCR